MSDEEKDKNVNPLLEKDPYPMKDVGEWLVFADAASSYEDMLSAIQGGFKYPVGSIHGGLGRKEEDELQRLDWYFKLADGWCMPSSFFAKPSGDSRERFHLGEDSNGHPIRNTVADNRRELAQRSAIALNKNYFAKLVGNAKEGDNIHLLDLTFSQPLFSTIVWFFRIEGDTYPIVRNISTLPDSKNGRYMVPFLKRIGHYIFERQMTMQKPWAVQILAALNEFDYLWDRALDDACLSALLKMALKSHLRKLEHAVSKDRRVETLEEAVYAGSKTAKFLVSYKIKIGEENRLFEIVLKG